jgi:hypothetical protein
MWWWQRRRRHNDGPFYWNSSRFRPSSWGWQEGPVSYNETRRQGSIRLGWLGQIRFGPGRRRGERTTFLGSVARFIVHVVTGLIFLFFVAVVILVALRAGG